MLTVLAAIGLMFTLSLLRVPIVAAIIFASLLAGMLADMSFNQTIQSFNQGIKNGAAIALSYACLGGFAAGLAKSGVPSRFCLQLASPDRLATFRAPGAVILLILLIVSCCSQNLVPIHIAFIPIMLPGLLVLLNKIRLDRRAVACVIAFGLVAPYMILPFGFGAIYIREILFPNLAIHGINTSELSIFKAMWLPLTGMIAGLCFSIFVSYRKPRDYETETFNKPLNTSPEPSTTNIRGTLLALFVMLAAQLITDSITIGALLGFCVFTITGVISLKETDDVFLTGIKMMAGIGFVMISAQGFAEVLKDSGQIGPLVDTFMGLIGQNVPLAVLAMLLTGLLITLGIGSSFSTIPVIATLFVPVALEMQLEPLAILALIATAGALGDAGSPVSETTLGPTMGLNADHQHDHMRDTVIPTFLHFNLPLLIAGWLAVLLLNS